jgi:hypothetical protein
MRLGVAGVVGVLAIALAAQARDVASAQTHPRTSSECAWSRLTDSEKSEMIMGGATQRTNTAITVVLPSIPNTVDMRAISAGCAPDREGVVDIVSAGLQWRAREESARLALTRVGRDPALVDAVLEKVFPVRRVQMGDALACPGGGRINPDWDHSVAGAIRMMRDPTINRLVYSLTALAIFARAAQEGVERRLGDAAAPCRV